MADTKETAQERQLQDGTLDLTGVLVNQLRNLITLQKNMEQGDAIYYPSGIAELYIALSTAIANTISAIGNINAPDFDLRYFHSYRIEP